MKYPSSLFSLALVATAGVLVSLPVNSPGQGEPKPKTPTYPQKLTAEEMRLSEANTILPLPGEILGALRALTAADWATAAKSASGAAKELGDSASRAMRLGVRVADAFLAIESRDQGLLDQCAVEILDLAGKLGAPQAVLENGKKVRDLARDGQWAEVVPVLDRIQQDTTEALKKIDDEDSATLSLAAGWLRGVHLVAGQLQGQYSESGAKVLRQGGLVEDLLGRLSKLSDSAKKSAAPLVGALTQIQPLTSGGTDAFPSREAAGQITAAAAAGLAGVL